MRPFTRIRKIGKTLTAAVLLAIVFGAGRVAAAERKDGTRRVSIPGEAQQRLFKVLRVSPLMAAGTKLGTTVLYDDPATSRGADYLEVYDTAGGLVAVSWFDRFGIQRIAVDRAFIDGKEQLEGVFVAVVDDNFI